MRAVWNNILHKLIKMTTNVAGSHCVHRTYIFVSSLGHHIDVYVHVCTCIYTMYLISNFKN